MLATPKRLGSIRVLACLFGVSPRRVFRGRSGSRLAAAEGTRASRDFDLESEGKRAQLRRSCLRQNSPPFMLGILALELLFQFWVGLGPEGSKAVGHLNGPVVRSEDVNGQRHAARGNLEIVRDTVKVLDARAENRRGVLRIGDFGAAAAGKLEALRGMFFDELLLPGSQDRPDEVQDRTILDIPVIRGVLAGEMDDIFPLGSANLRNMVLRKRLSQKVHPRDPLLNRIVPLVEGKVSVCDGVREARRSFRRGVGVAILRLDDEIAKDLFPADDDPFL